MASEETVGGRIRRLRHARGLSLAKVSRGDFSRAYLNQIEMGKSQPSTRVLRVIAGRLGTEVDYLIEGRLPYVERQLALERARVLVARREPRRAILALAPTKQTLEWPLVADVLLCRAAALRQLDRLDEAAKLLAKAKELIEAHKDGHRLQRLHAVERGDRFVFGNGDLESAINDHLRLADRAQRAGETHDQLEHYRAARILLEV